MQGYPRYQVSRMHLELRDAKVTAGCQQVAKLAIVYNLNPSKLFGLSTVVVVHTRWQGPEIGGARHVYRQSIPITSLI